MSSPADLFSTPDPSPAGRGNVITVTELNRRARNLLEANLELLWVAGELSNVTRAASGHWYFSLKDRDAQVRCVMFRSRAGALGFTPEAGMQVEVRALPSLYEARGDFQLGVENMRRAGLGALFEAFERLKAKLQSEGLFDPGRKRPLPAFPRAIGIVTSLQAAALRDVLATLRRRAPMIPVIVYPTAVQGTTAAAEIAGALDAARMRGEVDVVILCRGGGSIEDLWSFNEMAVARAIARFQDSSAIPVVAGVGHETDFSIADFVADQRAATPTAAAELCSPNADELRTTVGALAAAMRRNLFRKLGDSRQRIDHAQRALVSPTQRIAFERQRLQGLQLRLPRALTGRTAEARHAISLLLQRLYACRPATAAHLDSLARMNARLQLAATGELARHTARLENAGRALRLLDPDEVLQRGYAMVKRDGRVVRDANALASGDAISIRLGRGGVSALVTGKS